MSIKQGMELYTGREQAYVKHELLTAYLERFMMILGQHFPRVLYVDCFAGPWESTAADYSDTSFGRAVQIIKACQSKLRSDFGRNPGFKALFLERDPAAFAKLKQFADQASGERLEVFAWQGEFQDRVDDIVDWIGSDFSFVLIDPKGYKEVIAPSTLAPLLKLRNVEALINYMWQFLSLAVGHLDNSAHRQNLVALFGEEVANAPVAGSADREGWLLDLYRSRLVQLSKPSGDGRTRTVSFPVEYPGRETTKYFLIHVTHNDLGVIKFSEASQEASATQRSVRFKVIQQKKETKTGIADLFPTDETEIVVGDRALTEPWLQLMPEVGSEVEVNESVMAQLIEKYNCFMPELQSGVVTLIKSGQVANLDMSRMRPKNGVHYKKRERLKRLR